MMKIIAASFIPELPKNAPKHSDTQKNSKSHHPRKRSLQDIQSRQLLIFNNKIETKQTRLTKNLNQLQVHVQLLKHNMKSDYVKRYEF